MLGQTLTVAAPDSFTAEHSAGSLRFSTPQSRHVTRVHLRFFFFFFFGLASSSSSTHTYFSFSSLAVRLFPALFSHPSATLTAGMNAFPSAPSPQLADLDLLGDDHSPPSRTRADGHFRARSQTCAKSLVARCSLFLVEGDCRACSTTTLPATLVRRNTILELPVRGGGSLGVRPRRFGIGPVTETGA